LSLLDQAVDRLEETCDEVRPTVARPSRTPFEAEAMK
jgi:hypothetical protein